MSHKTLLICNLYSIYATEFIEPNSVHIPATVDTMAP